MPFTVSHVAAVLPFRKLNLTWSAFVIGTMAPDFPYVVGTTEYRDFGHVMPGLLLFTVPASLVALWMFHNVLKRPVIGLMPAGIQLRLRDQMAPFPFAGPRRFLAILGSVLLGVATHVVWDSLTHSYTWAYFHIRWLRGFVHVPFIGIMPIHSVSQYTSSIVGLVALAIWVWLWYRRTPVSEGATRQSPRSRFALGLVMFARRWAGRPGPRSAGCGYAGDQIECRPVRFRFWRHSSGSGFLAAPALLCAGFFASDVDYHLT